MEMLAQKVGTSPYNNAKIYYSELEKYFHIYEIHSDRKLYK